MHHRPVTTWSATGASVFNGLIADNAGTRCQSIRFCSVCVPQIYDFLSIVFNAFIGCSKWTAGGDYFVDLVALAIGSADQLGSIILPSAKCCPSPALVDIRGTDSIAIHQPVLQIRRKILIHRHTLKPKTARLLLQISVHNCK